MKFIFKSSPRLPPLLLAGLLGCRGPSAPIPPAAADGRDAQRLVALLDYVGGDYRLAVRDGRVVSPGEYEEQVRFVADAKAMAAALLGPEASGERLLALIAGVEDRVRAKADPAAVAEACRAARDEAVARFRLRTMPTERPSLARAEALYAQSCAACHGVRGDAATPRAKELDPSPASFKDPNRLRELSPYRVYNALTFGVPGTAMASFEALSPSERWSLAFYVFRLGHEGEEAGGPVALPLGEMAARSDGEILEALHAESHPSPAAALVHIRREAPFTEPPASAGIERTRRLLRQAVAAHVEGRARDADRLVLDAYLQGFEPLEPQFRARDGGATLAAERAFRDLRTAISRGERGAVRSRAEDLEALLFQLSEGRGRPVLPLGAAFLIYFREGVEAALLVGALLAGPRRLGRPEAARFIHAGWMAALPLGVLTWWVFERILSLGAGGRELLEAVVALLAAGVLFSVSFWMISKADSRRWMGYLRRRLEQSLSRRNLLMLSALAFLAVYREAVETVLFTQALLLASPAHRGQVFSGAAAGVVAVAALAVLMNRTVLRLPLGPFFAVSGALLCVLAISFAGSGIYALVASGYLTPRPVSFPEIRWMGIHADLTGLLVQLTIVLVIAAAGLMTLRRRLAEARAGRRGEP